MIARTLAVVACLCTLVACQSSDRVDDPVETPRAQADSSSTTPEQGEVRVTHNPPWYEDEILAFERADRADPPRKGVVVFTGSSSVRMWKTLSEDMDPVPVINRGFGGSKTPEVLAEADRIVFPYEPRVIVYYCGDNDLGTWSTDAEAAARGFTRFADRVHRRLPGTKILYMSIKPSLARWSNWDAMERANAIVESYCDRHAFAEYLDLATPLLGVDGTPDGSLFLDDGLHLNAEGYERWTAIVRPRVLAAWNATGGS